MNLNGIAAVPLYLRTNVVATPNAVNQSITMYWFVGDLCFDMGSGNLNDIDLFPLEVPRNASYEGTDTINGEKCTVWGWTSTYKFNAEIKLWVGMENSDIVRVELLNSPEGRVVWEFSDTQVGPFNPAIYDPPSMACPTFPYDTNEENDTSFLDVIARFF
eukprot:Phypoly_transcript_14130.p1 GENE.Phypoly_transcript_14130~~Phypoly_transcript_14130.p1  ORF type:complete len:160 (+),score=30.38 Phypoly_transcript_14130:479-958(+)